MIFSDVNTKVNGATEEIALDYLKQFSFTNVHSVHKLCSPWVRGTIRVGESGIEIAGPTDKKDTYLVINGLTFTDELPIKISKVVGEVDIYLANCSLNSLEQIFTPDCTLDRSLFLQATNSIFSLRGCPKKMRRFSMSMVHFLHHDAYVDGPTECRAYEWLYQGKFEGYDTQEALIRDQVADDIARRVSGLNELWVNHIQYKV